MVSLDDIVTGYIRRNPREAMSLAVLIDQLATRQKLNDRRNFNGHIAGSGIVLNPARDQILLIYHKTYNRWQQPGGHWESDDEANPLEAAQREVGEETGVSQLTYLPVDEQNPLVPFDLNTHMTVARQEKDEPAHWHHDFRYVFISDDTELSHQESEVAAAHWFAFDAPEADFMQRIIAKLRSDGFIE